MYRMRQPKTGRLIGWIAIPFLCVILFVLMLSGLRPVILQYAENYMVHEASFALYEVMTDTVYQNRTEYENLVQLEHDEQQAVTALRTDGITASHLKIQIAQAVHEALDQLEKSQVEIPLGTLLGSIGLLDRVIGAGWCVWIGQCRCRLYQCVSWSGHQSNKTPDDFRGDCAYPDFDAAGTG